MMKFSPIITGLLPGLVASSCTNGDCCSLHVLGTQMDFLNIYTKYAFDCGEATTFEQVAMCLVQRNSLENLLNCAYWNEKEAFAINVPLKGALDTSQGPQDDIVNYPNDGKLRFNPKGLLTAIAMSKQCQHAKLINILRICPYSKLQDFTSCLCCERIDDDDIEKLRRCIISYSPRYAKRDAVMATAEWSCRTWCQFPRKKPKCPAGSRLSPQDSSACEEPVVDGKLFPLGALRGRADDSDFANFATWSMTSKPTGQTRTAYTEPTVVSSIVDLAQTTEGIPTASATTEPLTPPGPPQEGGGSDGNKSGARSGQSATSFRFLFSALGLIGMVQHL